MAARRSPPPARADGAKRSRRESSRPATQRLPSVSNATDTSVSRAPLGVVIAVAGARSPVASSWSAASRSTAAGVALAIQSPVSSGETAPVSGST